MTDFLADLRHEFLRHKGMADRAMAPLSDDEFFRRPGAVFSPMALTYRPRPAKFASGWTASLTTDAEKPTRHRDGEFLLTDRDTRPSLLAAWERGWAILTDTPAGLTDADLDRSVTIR